MKALPSFSLLHRWLSAAAVVVVVVLATTCRQTTASASTTTTTADLDRESPSFRVAGYLPDYRFYINVNATATFLTDLMLFSVAPKVIGSDNVMLTACCLNNQQFDAARQAKAYKQQKQQETMSSSPSSLNLWLTVGGGGRSDHFHKHPFKLATAIKDLAIKQKMDGIDLNCEHFPSQQDYQRYMKWVNSTAVPMWKKHGLQVSIALHAGQFMVPDVYKAVDRIHLMAYDLPPSGPGARKQYHADLHSVRVALSRLIGSGCPADKILLGIPAYARHEDNPGLTKSYAELVDEMEKESIQPLDSFGSWKGYQAESPQAVRTKVSLARSMKLGGVFFWELGQDKQHLTAPGGILLEAAASGKTYHPVTTSVAEEL